MQSSTLTFTSLTGGTFHSSLFSTKGRSFLRLSYAHRDTILSPFGGSGGGGGGDGGGGGGGRGGRRGGGRRRHRRALNQRRHQSLTFSLDFLRIRKSD